MSENHRADNAEKVRCRSFSRVRPWFQRRHILSGNADLQRRVLPLQQRGNWNQAKRGWGNHQTSCEEPPKPSMVGDLSRKENLFARGKIRLPVRYKERMCGVRHMEIMAERVMEVTPPDAQVR